MYILSGLGTGGMAYLTAKGWGDMTTSERVVSAGTTALFALPMLASGARFLRPSIYYR